MNVYKANVRIYIAYFALACSRLSVSGDGWATFEIWEKKRKDHVSIVPTKGRRTLAEFLLVDKNSSLVG